MDFVQAWLMMKQFSKIIKPIIRIVIGNRSSTDLEKWNFRVLTRSWYNHFTGHILYCICHITPANRIVLLLRGILFTAKGRHFTMFPMQTITLTNFHSALKRGLCLFQLIQCRWYILLNERTQSHPIIPIIKRINKNYLKRFPLKFC